MTANFNDKVLEIRTQFQKAIEASGADDVPQEQALELIRLHRKIGHKFKLK